MIYSIPVNKITTIYEDNPYKNIGNDPLFEIGKHSSGKDLCEQRALIEFDIHNIPSNIKEKYGENIQYTFRAYCDRNLGLPTRTLEIEYSPLLCDWEQGYDLYYSDFSTPTRNQEIGATWTTPTGSTIIWTNKITYPVDLNMKKLYPIIDDVRLAQDGCYYYSGSVDNISGIYQQSYDNITQTYKWNDVSYTLSFALDSYTMQDYIDNHNTIFLLNDTSLNVIVPVDSTHYKLKLFDENVDAQSSNTATSINVTDGGIWNKKYTQTKSIEFPLHPDKYIDFDITNIMKYWEKYPNYGFVMKLNSDYIKTNAANNVILFQFHSGQTQTIFDPQLFVQYDDQVYNITKNGVSLYTPISNTDNPIAFVRYYNNKYIVDSLQRIYLGVQPKYPRGQYSQTINWVVDYCFPKTTYYKIVDLNTGHDVLPYNMYNKVSCDINNGCYIDFYTTMLYPGRYYKFELKAVYDNGIQQIFSIPEFIFKIEN